MFDKKFVGKVGERAMELLREPIKKEFGLDVMAMGGTYNDSEYKLKVRFSEPLDKITPVRHDTSLSAERELEYGLAPRGTKVISKGKGKRKFTIDGAKRTRYMLRDESGKGYTAPFDAVTLDLEEYPNLKKQVLDGTPEQD
jgi:hypothetical protein